MRTAESEASSQPEVFTVREFAGYVSAYLAEAHQGTRSRTPSQRHRRQRAAAPARRRGSRRSSTGTSSSSTDPGDDDDPDPSGDPEPQAGGENEQRFCDACSKPCRDTERSCAACRKRRSRLRKLQGQPKTSAAVKVKRGGETPAGDFAYGVRVCEVHPLTRDELAAETAASLEGHDLKRALTALRTWFRRCFHDRITGDITCRN